MTYADLQLLIQDTLQRGDVAHAVPGWVRLAEAQLWRDLRVAQMVEDDTLMLRQGAGELPEEWLEAQTVLHGDTPLRYVPRFEAERLRDHGGPVFGYTLRGRQLEIVPRNAKADRLTILYYARPPAFDEHHPSNWLLEEWPDLYLYGALVHAARYLKEPADEWAIAYAQALEQARMADERAAHAGSPLKVRARAFG